MFVVEFVFACVISMICAAILLPVTARSGWRLHHPGLEPLGAFGLLFTVFLGTWAAGLWLAPVALKLWGVAWVSFLAVGFVVALLSGAQTVPRHVGGTGDVKAGDVDASDVEARARALPLVALLLVVLLTLAVVAGYAWEPVRLLAVPS